MAIPITIEKLLTENVVEWARIEFKEGWNPDTTLKTISAFANDIDNWGGGYIVIGAKEKDGKLVRPVTGIAPDAVDRIQKDLLRYCKYLKPVYIPQSEPVYFDGKLLLLVWCPGGYERPYACPKAPDTKNSEKIYYIRKLSSTIEATDTDVKELMSLSHNIPFDDRINPKAEMKDLKYPIIKNYLQNVDSSLLNDIDTMDTEQLARNLRIADGPSEYYKPLNVGILFFNDHPESFFPYSQIEVVNIPDPTGQGMEERIFTGPIDDQLRNALNYIKNNVIAEKVFKISGQAEAVRVKNYSYEAIEEFLSNAIYHKSYQIHEPVTVRIEADKIEITIKNNFSDMLPMVINYINQFSEIFNIKIETFSLETVLQLRNIDLNLSNSIKNKIIPSNSLFYEADDIVWQVAHKKKIHKQDNDIIMSERINCSEESESLAKIEYDIIMNVKKNKDISNEEHLKELDSMTNTNISDIERVLG